MDRFLPNTNVQTVRYAMQMADMVMTESKQLRIPVETALKGLAVVILDLRELISQCLEGKADAIKAARRIVEP